jgi:hypothetical protein
MPMTGYPAPPPMKQRPAPPPPMDPAGVDYGDGVLVPPMAPYGAPPPAPPQPVPGANAGGGPGQPVPETGPGIFGSMFHAGQPPATPLIPGMPPPLNAPMEPPRNLQAQPMMPMGPMAGQGPGPNAPMRRFPRATSLIPSGPPQMRQGY